MPQIRGVKNYQMCSVIFTKKHEDSALFFFDKRVWDEKYGEPALKDFWENASIYKFEDSSYGHMKSEMPAQCYVCRYYKKEAYDSEYEKLKKKGGFIFRFRGFMSEWEFGDNITINDIQTGEKYTFTSVNKAVS